MRETMQTQMENVELLMRHIFQCPHLPRINHESINPKGSLSLLDLSRLLMSSLNIFSNSLHSIQLFILNGVGRNLNGSIWSHRRPDAKM
ncbi:hypothetical protein FRX31_019850 [Thalictrum thalictroides]|uniref:Uncharacterized protein n=1 Tax=Thalictrum thalictroides TaxID=46969 RepID=A0A7J6W089_THATH|nr:hypothetical protein FRX31_019850 [Thalictrum thalictroides]